MLVLWGGAVSDERDTTVSCPHTLPVSSRSPAPHRTRSHPPEPHSQRGADISFLSAFPAEKEFLFPPLTFLYPVKDVAEVRPSRPFWRSQPAGHAPSRTRYNRSRALGALENRRACNLLSLACTQETANHPGVAACGGFAFSWPQPWHTLAWPTLPYPSLPHPGRVATQLRSRCHPNRIAGSWSHLGLPKLVSPQYAEVGLNSVCRSWSDLSLVQVVKLGNRMFYVIDVEPVLP